MDLHVPFGVGFVIDEYGFVSGIKAHVVPPVDDAASGRDGIQDQRGLVVANGRIDFHAECGFPMDEIAAAGV